METSKEVALTICEKIQNEYPKRPLWQTMIEIEDLIDKHVAKQLNIHSVGSLFYCQREIEGESECDSQCGHCKEYYKPLEQ